MYIQLQARWTYNGTHDNHGKYTNTHSQNRNSIQYNDYLIVVIKEINKDTNTKKNCYLEYL